MLAQDAFAEIERQKGIAQPSLLEYLLRGASQAPSGFHGLVCAVTVWDSGPDSARPLEGMFDEVIQGQRQSVPVKNGAGALGLNKWLLVIRV